jgi:hypothetical protein
MDQSDKVSFWLAAVCPLMTQSGHHLGLGSNSIPVRAYGMLGPRASPELLPWLNLKLLSLREAQA